ncbi:hypothetical protein Cadr_000012498 [Camelus dromedarius]|uniref:Uncharacterized protein n=1 Tax=Camelus dromedarius TaxID=9838 RepID=A0A5N4D9F5_CAMDR|nr:hypothetical protein Cadr_000012498 [Camelus dromedarius]
MVMMVVVMMVVMVVVVVVKERKEEKGKEEEEEEEEGQKSYQHSCCSHIPITLDLLVDLVIILIIFLNTSNIVKLQNILKEFPFGLLAIHGVKAVGKDLGG